jgi:hypothetical protein
MLAFPGIDPVEMAVKGIEMIPMGQNNEPSVSGVVPGKKDLSRPGSLHLLPDGGGDIDPIMKGSERLNDLPL